MAVQFTFRVDAGPHSRFTEEAARSFVGTGFDAKVEERHVGRGKVLSASLAPGGAAIDVTVEFPDEVEPLLEALSDIVYRQPKNDG